MELRLEPEMLSSFKRGVPPSSHAVLHEWKCENGAVVQKDQVVAILATDFFNLEVVSESAGRLQYVAALGQKLPADAMICTVEPLTQVNAHAIGGAGTRSTRLIDLAHQLFA